MTTLSIIQIPVGPMMNFAYLIGDADAKCAAIIDPGWDAKTIITAAAQGEWKIEKILLTHTHFDHVEATGELVASTGAVVYVHREELNALPADLSLHATEEGTVIPLGGVEITCLHTPGHTPGSQCFLAEEVLFTGDTLFVDGCGRVDLPGSDPRRMVESLKRLAALPSSLTIYPGHDYGGRHASLQALLQSNPFLKQVSEEMLL